MKHSEYVAYFKDIATRQPDLAHTASERHFARVIYSEWPNPMLQLNEFLAVHKSGLQYPFMLCETWTRRTRKHSSEHLEKIYKGSILIADHLKSAGDFDALDVLFDKTDSIAGDIEGYMLEEFEEHWNSDNVPKRSLIEDAFQMEHIGPFSDHLYGTRLEFQYRQSAGRWDVHDISTWITPITPDE